MDESGFPPLNQGTQRVVGRAGQKIQHKQGSANRENVTALVTICTDGTILWPLVVFKGTYLMQCWIENNEANASFSTSPNGWTNSELALNWLKTEFDPLTKDKAGGNVCVLILDGHISHLSLEFVQYCIENNIVVLVYPPHCTHALQGLDVVCFAKMKKEWHDAIDAFEDRTLQAVGKEDFLEVFGAAFLKAFDAETVKAAFRATGVHPYDPTIITEKQMKPSELTSTKTTFPLAQSSPV
ncbi:DDE-domain-containing protein [Schizopora paradoxa]|uniref:DDE-domain-containing protein n=1 Tax=Schizopora paradoxa TaxID=27342 RepID=A0A0H2SD19_9AGAM|nr:DDE-domain-containing protein [Schizopora paradoxa]